MKAPDFAIEDLLMVRNRGLYHSITKRDPNCLLDSFEFLTGDAVWYYVKDSKILAKRTFGYSDWTVFE